MLKNISRSGLRLVLVAIVMSVAAGLVSQIIAPQAIAQSGVTTVTITDDVLVSDVKRLGINVGSRSWYGAEQYIKNMIDNPGFEAGVYGMVAHAAAGSSGQRFEQDFWDTTWNNDQYNIGQPVGFWNG